MDLLNRFSLDGKKALINGGEFPLSFEIASGLCEAGAEVFLCGADWDALAAKAECLQKNGAKAGGLFFYEQGTKAASLKLVEWIRSDIGTLDIFIDNSSHGLHKGWDLTFDEIYDDLKRTQLGLMLTVQQVGAYMADQRRGSVIFITDTSALVGCNVHLYEEAPQKFDEDFSLTYGFVKGSFVNYARQAAGFLGEHGIRCNCIALAPQEKDVPEGFAAAFIRQTHLKRMTAKEDIQSAVVFLASDASSFITGVTLPVDGGYTAK